MRARKFPAGGKKRATDCTCISLLSRPGLVGQRLHLAVLYGVEKIDEQANNQPDDQANPVGHAQRVHQVAVGQRHGERALAQGTRRIGDEQVGIEPLLEAQTAAGRARARRRVEGEQAA